MNIKIFITLILLLISSQVFGITISGATSVNVNDTETYSYTDGFLMINPNWAVTGGTILSSGQLGTNYNVTIQWTQSGTGEVSLFNGEMLKSELVVTVTNPSPPLTAGIIGETKTICYYTFPGTLTNELAPSGGTGPYTYTWQMKHPLLGVWQDIAGTNSTTFSPSKLTLTSEYRRQVTSGSETASTASVIITVGPQLTSAGTINTLTETTCEGATASVISSNGLPTGGSLPYTYQWQISATGLIGSWSSAPGTNNGVSYSPGVLPDTRYFRRQVTDDCGAMLQTTHRRVNVTEDYTMGTISGQSEFCYGTQIDADLTYSGDPIPSGNTFIWQKQVPNTTSWVNVKIDGVFQITNRLLEDGVQNGTKYRAYFFNACGFKTTSPITLINAPRIKIASPTGAATVCSGEGGTVLSSTGATDGLGNYTYEWVWSDTESGTYNVIVNPPGATNGTTYTTGSQSTKKYYKLRGSDNCHIINSASVLVDIYPALVSAGSINTLTETICEGATASVISSNGLPTGGKLPYTYQWQISSTGLIGSWSSAPGTNNGVSYNPGVLPDTRYFRRQVTDDCGATLETIHRRVNTAEDYTMGTVSGQSEFCFGTQIDADLTYSGDAIPSGNTFIWQKQVPNTTSWVNVKIDGVFQITNRLLEDGVQNGTKYRAYFFNACGFKTTSPITLINAPRIKIASPTGAATVCSGQSGTILSSTGATDGLGNYTYEWVWSDTESGTYSVIVNPPGATNGTTYTAGGQSTKKYYKLRASDNCHIINSDPVLVDIYPALVSAGTINTLTETICEGATASVISSNGLPTGGKLPYTYQWQISSTGLNGSWGSAPGTNNGVSYSPGVLPDTRYFRRQVTDDCGTMLQTTHRRVNTTEEYTMGTVSGQSEFCYGTQIDADLTYSGDPIPSGNTFIWQKQVPNTTSWVNVKIDGVFQITNRLLEDGVQNGTKYRAYFFNACGFKTTSPITLINAPRIKIASPTGAATVCSGQGGTILSSTGATDGLGNYTYEWVWSDTESGTYNVIVNPPGATNGTTYTAGGQSTKKYYKLRASDNCHIINSDPVLVDIYPALVSAGSINTLTETICEGATASVISSNGLPTGGKLPYTYQWQISSTGLNGSWGSAPGTNNGVSYSPGVLPDTRYFRRQVTDDCGATLETIHRRVNTAEDYTMGTVSGQSEFCYGTQIDADLTYSGDAIPSGNTFIWQKQVPNTTSWVNVKIDGVFQITNRLLEDGVQNGTKYRAYFFNACGFKTTSPITLITAPRIKIASPTGAATVCSGQGGTILSSTGATDGLGNYTYEWVWSDTESGTYNVIVNPPGATNGTTYTAGGQSTKKYYKLRASDNCHIINSDPVLVDVYSLNPGSIDVEEQMIAQNTEASVIMNIELPIDGDGNYTYLWQSSDTGLDDSWEPAPDTNNEIDYSPGILSSTKYFRRQVTDGCGSIDYTEIHKVDVVIIPIPSDPLILSRCMSTSMYIGEFIKNFLVEDSEDTPEEIKYYWQISPTGESMEHLRVYTTTEPGTFYVRTYHTTLRAWSEALPVTIANIISEHPEAPAYMVPQIVTTPSQVTFSFPEVPSANSYSWYTNPDLTKKIPGKNDNELSVFVNQNQVYYATAVNVCGNSDARAANAIIEISNDLNLNWVEKQGFNESGDVFTQSKAFFGLDGRALQSQTKNFAENQILASQGLVDEYNRNVLSSLSAPINKSHFQYKANFIQAQNGQIYDHTNFSGVKKDRPDPLANIEPGTLGWYYSDNNTMEARVPANDYPYSLSDYFDDGSEEVKRTSLPGDALRMGNGHEATIKTLPVGIKELRYYMKLRRVILGDESGNNDDIGEVFKQVSIDPNGKESITYIGENGATIASATVLSNIDEDDKVRVLIPATGETEFHVPNADGSVQVKITGPGERHVFNKLTSSDTPDYVFEDGVTEKSMAPGIYTVNVKGGSISYDAAYGHHAYNFYNNAGNLVASIAPKGLPSIFEYFVFPTDMERSDLNFTTFYTYDFQGRLIQMEEPDAGTTKYSYRRDGNIRFSQNAEQFKRKSVDGVDKIRYSYTNYDRSGRPIESGEYEIAAPSSPEEFHLSDLDAHLEEIGDDWMSNGAKKDWVKTTFDISYPRLQSIPELTGYSQEYLIGAVSYTENQNVITRYSYDEFGQVTWVIMEYAGLEEFFTVDYTYDYFGNVTEVAFQKNESADAFYHHYTYDTENRLSGVYTSLNGNFDIDAQGKPTSEDAYLHAKYYYYMHGPLKRVEYADDLQGIDYTYTVQGWLKAINNPINSIDNNDNEGLIASNNDAFAMSLDYHTDDYKRDGSGITPLDLSTSFDEQYGGNIKTQQWGRNYLGVARHYDENVAMDSYDSQTPNLNAGETIFLEPGFDTNGGVFNTNVDPNATFIPDSETENIYMYEYDEKYQLKTAVYKGEGEAYTDANLKNTLKDLDYDENGNILKLIRYNNDGEVKDNFTKYHYTSTNQNDQPTNRLTTVDGYTTEDYQYNDIGQLTASLGRDAMPNQYMEYDVTGKVTGIYSDSEHTDKVFTYEYDDRGFRILKRDEASDMETWYVRDASGNILAIYEKKGAAKKLSELPIYGSGKIGTSFRNNLRHKYNYELTDHLGNVRAVVSKLKFMETATMEEDRAIYEESVFENLSSSRHNSGGSLNTTYQGTKVALLNGAMVDGTPNVIGPARQLKVSAGDRVMMDVYARYEYNGANNGGFDGGVLDLLAGSFGIPGGSETAQTLDGFSFGLSEIANLANFVSNGSDVPKAYLQYLLFDKDFNYVSTSNDPFKMVTEDARITDIGGGSISPAECITLDVDIEQDGYIYIYVVNETLGTSVYFDDLTIRQLGIDITQTTDYYPFGSVMNHWEKEHDIPQDQEVYNTTFETNEDPWVASSNSSITLENDQLKVTTAKHLNGANGYYDLQAGETYQISMDVDMTAFSEAPLEFSVWRGSSKVLGEYITTNGNFTQEITPTESRTYRINLRLRKYGYSGADQIVYVDNVRIVRLAEASLTARSGEKYRYGYQGEFAEKDEETGYNHFELRDFDSRIGKWLIPDPARQHYSPFVAMGNNPIGRVDPDGGTDYTWAEGTSPSDFAPLDIAFMNSAIFQFSDFGGLSYSLEDYNTEVANQIVNYAELYVELNTMPGNWRISDKSDPTITGGYSIGAKNGPGMCVDCSGLIANSIVSAGLRNPNHTGTISGILNIEAHTLNINQMNVRRGDAITFRNPSGYKYHGGIVTNVSIIVPYAPDNPNIQFIHSGSSTGPIQKSFMLKDTKSYYGSRKPTFHRPY